MDKLKKNVAIAIGTKSQLDDLKKELGFRTLSEVVAYLVAHYNETWGSITKLQDRQYRNVVQSIEGQSVFY